MLCVAEVLSVLMFKPPIYQLISSTEVYHYWEINSIAAHEYFEVIAPINPV